MLKKWDLKRTIGRVILSCVECLGGSVLVIFFQLSVWKRGLDKKDGVEHNQSYMVFGGHWWCIRHGKIAWILPAAILSVSDYGCCDHIWASRKGMELKFFKDFLMRDRTGCHAWKRRKVSKSYCLSKLIAQSKIGWTKPAVYAQTCWTWLSAEIFHFDKSYFPENYCWTTKVGLLYNNMHISNSTIATIQQLRSSFEGDLRGFQCDMIWISDTPT